MDRNCRQSALFRHTCGGFGHEVYAVMMTYIPGYRAVSFFFTGHSISSLEMDLLNSFFPNRARPWPRPINRFFCSVNHKILINKVEYVIILVLPESRFHSRKTSNKQRWISMGQTALRFGIKRYFDSVHWQRRPFFGKSRSMRTCRFTSRICLSRVTSIWNRCL